MKQEDILVRQAKSGDYESIAAINKAVGANSLVSEQDKLTYKILGVKFDLESVQGLHALDSVFTQLEFDYREIFVAEDAEGKIIACITASGEVNLQRLYKGAATTLPNALALVLHDAAVRKEARGIGYITQMLPLVEEYAAKSDVPYVAAEASESDKYSMETFEKRGFEKVKNNSRPGWVIFYKQVGTGEGEE